MGTKSFEPLRACVFVCLCVSGTHTHTHTKGMGRVRGLRPPRGGMPDAPISQAPANASLLRLHPLVDAPRACGPHHAAPPSCRRFDLHL